MPGTESEVDHGALLAETLDFLDVRRDGDAWVGRAPEWFGEVLFGGFVVAQAIRAAAKAAPAGSRLHSLHAYFLRPVVSGADVRYESSVLREGRSFASHQLHASQGGKPVLAMMTSFTADTDGYVYDLGGLGDVPLPDEAASEPGPGPWIANVVGPTPAAADGTRASTHRMWFRIPAALPDDPHLHTALLGFASDWTGIGGRPLDLEGDTTGMISLDHTVWFHRPARADEWLFLDVHSLVNVGGRGLLRGVVRDGDGRAVVSMCQEMLLRVVGS